MKYFVCDGDLPESINVMFILCCVLFPTLCEQEYWWLEMSCYYSICHAI